MVHITDILAVVGAFVAMCVVLYLSYVVSKALAAGSAKMGTAKYLQIVDRVPLGKDRYLVIARIGDKHFLIGVTDQGIEKLAEISEEDLQELQKPQNPDFKAMLGSIMSKKDKQ